jgi:hypothetical protein
LSDSVGDIISLTGVLTLPSPDDGEEVFRNEAVSLALTLIASVCVESSYHLIVPGINGYRIVTGNFGSMTNTTMRPYDLHPRLVEEYGLPCCQLYSQLTPKRNTLRLVSILRSWEASR